MPAALTTPERVAETVLAYYRLLDPFPVLAAELERWLLTLSEAAREELELEGLADKCQVPACKRYV